MAGRHMTTDFNYIDEKRFMPYVVKCISGNLYVYRQFRVKEKVITKYIGKFEKIVEFYIKHKHLLNGGPSGMQLN